METISFRTQSKGHIIEIFKEYSRFASKNIDVVLSVHDRMEVKSQIENEKIMRSMSLNTKFFKFDRQEANQR